MLDGVRGLEAGDVGGFGFLDRFTLACWIRPDDARRGTIVSRMLDEPQGEGYSVELVDGRIQVNLTKRWLDDAIRVRSAVVVAPGRWTHLAVSYDGSRKAAGVAIHLDGRQVASEVLLDELNQTFLSKNPFRIGAGGGSDSRYRGAIDDVRIHDDVLSAQEIAVLAAPESLATIAAMPPARRSPAQAYKLRLAFLETPAAVRFQQARKQVLALEHQKRALIDHLPTTMVMCELPQPRATHVLVRGQYDRPGEQGRARGSRLSFSVAVAGALESSGAGEVAGRSGEPPDGPGRGQPPLANVFWHGTRQDGRGLWLPGRAAQSSRAPRLAGDRADSLGLGRQVADPDSSSRALAIASRRECPGSCSTATPRIVCSLGDHGFA